MQRFSKEERLFQPVGEVLTRGLRPPGFILAPLCGFGSRQRGLVRGRRDAGATAKGAGTYPATSSSSFWSISKLECTFCTSSCSSSASIRRIIWLAAAPSSLM
jgi:hypothetical protein